MKLISCYIENFGNISAKSFDFDGNLICVCEANGFGKSTLAAFIKAMFYGLPASRANSKEFDDRQHYYPFSGGTFGGNLTFEREGKIYKIERTFAKKSATGDECSYYCNDSRIPVPESIGKEVFGLDEQSFTRTVFIDSTDTETGATSGIGAKLNNFVDDTQSGANYDTAKDILEKAKKTYKAARGGGGKINECKENIITLESKKRNIEVIGAGLGEKYLKREALLAEIAKTESMLKKASSLNGVLQEWDNYERMLADADTAKAELEKLKAEYPAGLPDGEQLTELNEKVTKKASAESRLESAAFSADKQARLAELENSKLKNAPEESVIESYREKISALNAKKEQLKNAPPATATKDADAKKSFKITVLIIAFAAVLLIVGIVLMVAVNLIAGVTALVLGVCCVCASGFTYFNTKLKVVAAPAEVTVDYSKLQSEINLWESEIKSFISGYGYLTDSGAEADFNSLVKDINDFKIEYTVLNRERQACEENSIQTRKVIEECSAAINGILNKYEISAEGGLLQTVKKLENDSRDLIRLEKSCKQLSERAQAYKAERKLTQKPQGEKLDTAELSAQFSALNTDLSRIDRAIAEDEAVTEKLQDCKNELETQNELLEEYQQKYEILSLTAEYLARAEQNLKDKYISPVKDKFLKYSLALEKALGEKVSMDKDFKVYFERNGENRSDRHLSAGQKSLCALCLRLALIDNMYGGERPFTVMDDPFVNLDAQHMARAAELLKQISANGQIIYFCCHDSREIKYCN